MSETPNSPTVEFESVPRYRLKLETAEVREVLAIRSPADASEVAAQLLSDEPFEAMLAIYLDTRHRTIGWTVPYRGTLNRAAVEPRALLAAGLLVNAAGFLLAHNHPSGDPTPSAEDYASTRRVAEAGEIVGVRLVDHVITTPTGRWLSLRERGGW